MLKQILAQLNVTSVVESKLLLQIHDIHDQGSWITLHVDVHAPVILIPQHSESSNVFHIRLGDLKVKNFPERTDCGKGVYQVWDRLSLSLDDLQITRCANSVILFHFSLSVM
jgi:hypothetical protein